MTKKLLGFQDVLKEELKDKGFRKYYEEEGRKLENEGESPAPPILSLRKPPNCPSEPFPTPGKGKP